MTDASAKPRVRMPAGSRSMSAGLPVPAAAPARPAMQAGYMRAFESTPMFTGWHPALREASDDVKAAWRLATARTIDAVHNSGYLNACRDKSVAAVVGDGLQLDAKPVARALGWSDDQAAEFANVVEPLWFVYVNSARAADALGCASVHQRAAQAYVHSMATGEILATLPYFANAGSAQQTKLRVHPAWRFSSHSEAPNLIQGVRINAAGAPVAYRLKRKTAYGGEEEFELQRHDSAGRPIVVHIFEGEPDQVRGISDFVSVLKVVRQFDQLCDATLTTTLIQTIFAGMFKSAATPEQVLDAVRSQGEQEAGDFERLITSKAQWYDKTDLSLGVHGKLLHGFPGDELQFFRAEHPGAGFDPFAKFLLLECATASALTKAEFLGDYAGESYSAIQMGTAVNWPRVLRRRKFRVAPLYQALYEAWLEEEIEKGRIRYPGGVETFLMQRDAAASANWKGPVKPQADELKMAKAAETLRGIDFPDSYIFEMYGLDRDDVYDELAREQRMRAAKGLPPRGAAAADPVGNALVTQAEGAPANG